MTTVQNRYGDGSVVGRRIREDNLVEKGLIPASLIRAASSFGTGVKEGLGGLKSSGLGVSPMTQSAGAARKVGRLAGNNPGKSLAIAGGTTALAGAAGGRASKSSSPVTVNNFAKLYVEHNGVEWRDDDGNSGKGPYPIPGQAKRVKKFTIGKADDRVYIPERNRQRRQGVAIGGAAVGGGSLVGTAGRDAYKFHNKVKSLPENLPNLSADKAKALHFLRSNKSIAVPRSSVVRGAGGAGLLTAAALMSRRAKGRHDERWS